MAGADGLLALPVELYPEIMKARRREGIKSPFTFDPAQTGEEKPAKKHLLEFSVLRVRGCLENFVDDAAIPDVVGLFGKYFGADSQFGDFFLRQTLARPVAVDGGSRFRSRDDEILLRSRLLGLGRRRRRRRRRFRVGVVQDDDVADGLRLDRDAQRRHQTIDALLTPIHSLTNHLNPGGRGEERG